MQKRRVVRRNIPGDHPVVFRYRYILRPKQRKHSKPKPQTSGASRRSRNSSKLKRSAAAPCAGRSTTRRDQQDKVGKVTVRSPNVSKSFTTSEFPEPDAPFRRPRHRGTTTPMITSPSCPFPQLVGEKPNARRHQVCLGVRCIKFIGRSACVVLVPIFISLSWQIREIPDLYREKRLVSTKTAASMLSQSTHPRSSNTRKKPRPQAKTESESLPRMAMLLKQSSSALAPLPTYLPPHLVPLSLSFPPHPSRHTPARSRWAGAVAWRQLCARRLQCAYRRHRAVRQYRVLLRRHYAAGLGETLRRREFLSRQAAEGAGKLAAALEHREDSIDRYRI